MRKPTSGTNINIRKTDIMPAGNVSTYFQFASHLRCMKNKMTNIAFVQETAIMKAQIDWIPLSLGAVRPTQGKTLAVMQVSGGSQSFNAVNQMRVLGRWMRCLTIPNQSSVAKAFLEFDGDGRMKPSAYYNRIVDVMEELVKFTLLTRDLKAHLTDRYSERVESAERLSQRVNQKAI